MSASKLPHLLRLAACSSAAAFYFGCASKNYSPLAGTGENNPPTPESSTPEIVALSQEQPPVIGLDHFDPMPVATAPLATNSVQTNLPPTVPVAITKPVNRWISLNEWARQSGLPAPERLVLAGKPCYRLATPGGTTLFTIGSKAARWKNTVLWLGFPPRLVQGEPQLHFLDVEKSLAPLHKMSTSALPLGKIIVLDPGHGGVDGGTHGAKTKLEKFYTLDWALRTERLLTNAGWKVFLTRRTDTDVSLTNRIAYADKVQADLFLSLHFNSTFPQTQPTGIETYCLTPTGLPSTMSRGYADEEQSVFPNNQHDAENLVWAYRLHSQLLKTTRAHDDGIKRARFMAVLRGQNRPAVLIEGGFLSNPRDAANIDSGAYRESMAKAILDALD